ncbi:tRNA (adenosine(37)-N6)-threonylcarbamoyltransferase complex dimerization subunit type 1 TsaB [Clostridium sp. Marseille-P2415]|uniref:tRNA (adenosine(37)-N6)-threonylcarbamoyltransferase complex dimerization subunit type 1 TsaB n=1 Tax=Clostridium sp. Marseille-P2415 TaxID=1805471 RepID=UPI0009885006|nr:tRNA (adenosine(37)-N6)-threonylcarbamoyltransferase complex dimerization subunit type 1 TsaB [Clostridium sp. Marseille-P2415]
MRILGIESSSLVASVAVVADGVVTAEYTVNFKKTHSQTLLPMLDEIVKMVGLDLETIDAIAISGGPGSFTGLRIGSATGKGLGLALKKPLISVSTVDAMAYNLFGCAFTVCPIMDARRNQVYTGIYDNRNGFFTVKEPCAMDIGDLIEELNTAGQKVIFLGDGVPVYKSRIEEKIAVPFEFAPAHLNRQRAAAVAALGCRYYEDGRTISAAEHAPDYLRKPQAEREREEEALKGERHGS